MRMSVSQMDSLLLIVVAVVAIATLLLLLGAIIRFSIVSSWRTRGGRDRLSQPDVVGVGRVCGFSVPEDLVQFYREGSLTRLVEFSLVDKSKEPNLTWSFGGFYPLTSQDVMEQRRIHGITAGIPIADDMNKGVYFVNRDGRIMFRPPGRKRAETEVALSAEALSHFEVAEEK
jgi:hypothetical protein